MGRTYPQLLAILRAEFGDGPLSEELLSKVEQRLRELEPHRKLFITTMRGCLIGIGEGA